MDDVYVAIRDSKRIYPDSRVKEGAAFREKFERICSDEGIVLEPFGIDEAWLDVTKLAKRRNKELFDSAFEIAEEVQKRVREETSLCVSIGVSFNKAFSKLASDMKKNSGIFVISPDNYKETVWKLPVRNLLYVGKNTEEILKQNRLFTLSDIVSRKRSYMYELFGKSGENLWDYARGLDFSAVKEYVKEERTDSISNSRTLPYDIYTFDECQNVLRPICESVTERLRRRHLTCKTLRLYVRFCDLKSFTRQITFDSPTNSYYDVFNKTIGILRQTNISKPIRALGVSLDRFETERFATREIITKENFKKHMLDRTEESLRNRFGDDILCRANAIVKCELSKFSKSHPAFNHNI